MKLIHCADIHFGSKMDRLGVKKDERKAELRTSFEYLIEYANDNDIKVVLLSGDIFDKSNPSIKDKDYFYDLIKKNKDINFYYLKGNHDIDLDDRDIEIDNLKVFTDEWQSFDEDGVKIYGIIMDSANNSSFYSTLNTNKDDVNIVMLHGEVSDKVGQDCIKIDKLKNKNIDYLAIGHIHSYKTNKIDSRGYYCQPGCLMGRGFDECGEKGFVVINIDDKKVSHEFVENKVKSIVHKIVDLTGCKTLDDVKSVTVKEMSTNEKKNIYRVELIGEIPYNLDFDESDIESSLSSYYFVNVKINTQTLIDEEQFKDDKGIAGEFVRYVLNNDEYDEDTKKQIITTGLRALEGREI